MKPSTYLLLSLTAVVPNALASFTKRTDESTVLTWTKSGVRYRARSATVSPQAVTVIHTTTVVPTATFHLRSAPNERRIKRAFLNNWTYKGCANDDNGLPELTLPFSYQLAPEDVSSASCNHFCDERGNSLAALQNGDECWCGESASSLNFIDDSACDVPCAAQSGEICGGKGALSIYIKA